MHVPDRLLRISASRLVVLAFALACVLGGAAAQEARKPSPSLLPAGAAALHLQGLAQAPAALERPFDDPIEIRLRPDRRRVAPANCRELIEAGRAVASTTVASDWNVLQQRLADCHAVAALARAEAPVQSALPGELQGLTDAAIWPAGVWPAVSPDETAAARNARTLRQLLGAGHNWRFVHSGRSEPPALELRTRTYSVRLEWLARGDFDGDGAEDWLMRWKAAATGGSWRAFRTLLVTRAPSGALLEVKDL